MRSLVREKVQAERKEEEKKKSKVELVESCGKKGRVWPARSPVNPVLGLVPVPVGVPVAGPVPGERGWDRMAKMQERPRVHSVLARCGASLLHAMCQWLHPCRVRYLAPAQPVSTEASASPGQVPVIVCYRWVWTQPPSSSPTPAPCRPTQLARGPASYVRSSVKSI